MALEIDVEYQRGDFHLSVACSFDGSLTGVFGPSAAGKSTLLNLIAGLATPSTGRIVIDGEALFDRSKRVNLPPHRRRMGLVFQDSRLFPHYSVRGNLDYGRRRAAASERRFALEEIAELLGLESLLGRTVGGLSGGERQRVALGRALLASPRMLLLDEPLASLDRGAKRQILPLLRKMHRATGVPMVFVSHDLGELLALTDRLLIMREGRARGPAAFGDLIRDAGVLDLMHDLGLLNVLAMKVEANEPEEGITRLIAVGSPGAAAPPHVIAPPLGAALGAEVRIGIRPEDIALVLQPVQGVSIRNQLPGRIEEIIAARERTVCLVDVGFRLIVEITHHAVHSLGLEAGSPVWCLFKAQAIRSLEG